MSDTDSTRRSTTQVLGWVGFLVAGLALYFQIAEPSTGTRVGHAGRILGPVSVLLIALSLIRNRRGRGVLLVVGVALGVAALLLVLAGRSS